MNIDDFLEERVLEDLDFISAVVSTAHVRGLGGLNPTVSEPPEGREFFRWQITHMRGSKFHVTEERGGSQHVIMAYTQPLAEYVVRFQPERLLHECEVKLQTITMFRTMVTRPNNAQDLVVAFQADMLHWLLVRWAAMYSDHEDYDEAWHI